MIFLFTPGEKYIGDTVNLPNRVSIMSHSPPFPGGLFYSLTGEIIMSEVNKLKKSYETYLKYLSNVGKANDSHEEEDFTNVCMNYDRYYPPKFTINISNEFNESIQLKSECELQEVISFLLGFEELTRNRHDNTADSIVDWEKFDRESGFK